MKQNSQPPDPELRLKKSILFLVGAILVPLAVSLPAAYFYRPDAFAQYATPVTSIVSGALGILVGYIAGKASK